MNLDSLLTAAVLCMLAAGHGHLILKDKSYIKLKDIDGDYSINASTYNRIAFDYEAHILYVTAKEPGTLTAFTLAADGTPAVHKEMVFDVLKIGQPLDVEFCRPKLGTGPARVAVSFEDPHSASADGTVRVYHALTLTETHPILIKEITVGPQPVDIEFTEDCNVMLVANAGRPTKEGDSYRDPDGTISKIVVPEKFSEDSPVDTTSISFAGLFTGPGSSEYIEFLQESNFRFSPLRQPDGTLLTVMQNLEPEHIIVAPNFQTAYVSLPKNNAIARLNLEINQVSSVYPMGNRSWADYYLDVSDTDDEIYLRSYNIYSLLQPIQTAWISKDDNDWLIMLDSGRINDIVAYGYRDFERARVLMEKGAIETGDGKLETQLSEDNELGRLLVSTEDGVRNSDGKIEKVVAFGGRGFSIHNANNFQTVSAVIDNIEQVGKQYYRDVFNTAYLNNSSTPAYNAESTSPSFGPNLGAMAVGDFEGKSVMFFGGATSGILYVYQLSPETSCPQPIFHSVHRSGDTRLTWSQAYSQNSMGDIGITDMLYLKDENLFPLLIVASATSNSVSIYSVVDGPFNPERLHG